MATKGDISDLDELLFGGKPIIPLVSGFSRTRRSGVIRSDVTGGSMRQRKKFFNMPHIANVAFYLRSAAVQDFIQAFINRNEGKKFICHLSADRPIVEPYVVQALGDWRHVEVNALNGTVSCQFEIFSTSEVVLDQFSYDYYSHMGDDMYDTITGLSDIVEKMPIFVVPGDEFSRLAFPLVHLFTNDKTVEKLTNGTLTTVRATIGTFIDKNDGLLKTAAIDTIREEAEGYLNEVPSTSDVIKSEEYAAWVKTNAVITSNATTSPDGNLTADKLIPSAGTNSVRVAQAISYTIGDVVTISAFVKKAELKFVTLFFNSSDFSFFGVGNTVDLDDGSGTGSQVVRALSNGWFRVSITSTALATGSGDVISVTPNSSLDGPVNSVVGDGTSGIFAFGGQSEKLPYATSYIKTNTTPVTRASDNFSILATGNIPAANDEYSVLATVDLLGVNTSGGHGIFRVTGEGDRQALILDNTPIIRLRNGSTVIDGNPISGSEKIAFTVSSSGIKIYQSGLEVATGVVTTITGAKTVITIGSLDFSSQLSGHMSDFMIYGFEATPTEIALIQG